MLRDLDPFTVPTFPFVRWYVYLLFSAIGFCHVSSPMQRLFRKCVDAAKSRLILAASLDSHLPL